MQIDDDKTKSWMSTPDGGWKCRCGAAIDHPGACDNCIELFERFRARDRIGDAIASIPPRFRWAVFEDEQLAKRCTSTGARLARTAYETLRSGQHDCIVIRGATGVGKTSLACAILRKWIDDVPTGYAARYFSSLMLSRSRVDSSLGVQPWQITDAIKAKPLVLDDLGQESVGSDIVREVIHARHEDVNSTIVTTWLDDAAILERYGGGIDRRLFERAAVIELGSTGRQT